MRTVVIQHDKKADSLQAALCEVFSVEEQQCLIKLLKDEYLTVFPEVKISSRCALGGARSSHAPDENTIYLAEDFVAGASRNELIRALLQELINTIECFAR
ncbi:MAG: hypothetical protein AAFV90_26300 [Cyanobacteria bacterium J06634_5]